MLIALASSAHAQKVTLRIDVNGDGKRPYRAEYKNTHSSHASASKEVRNVIIRMQYEGYLLAQTDTVVKDSAAQYVRISTGGRYKWASLRPGNLDPAVALRFGLHEKLLFGKPFRYREIARTFDRIISYYENNGYPFAEVYLDSIQAESGQLSARIQVNRNKLFRIDSVKTIGDLRLNKKFLYRYLDVRPGMPYNEQTIAAISGKLRQLPFLSEKQPPLVQFTDKTNKLIMQLEKKNASQFDGIVGFLPDAVTGKALITGDVKLKLINGIFRNGETFDLEWRRLQTQTQDFKGSVTYPYLLGSPAGADYSLKIYRRDTTFIDIHNNIGLQYYYSGLNYFRVYFKQRTSNLISSSGLGAATSLPEYADISTGSYGAGVVYEKLDYRFNPRKGLSLSLNAHTGNRSIRRNPKINELAYQNVRLLSVQYQGEASLSYFVPIVGNSVFRAGAQAATVFGNAPLFRNELFRIGGIRTLRGFDEESIFASSYFIPTLEYRYLFGLNSHFVVFAEGAWYENVSRLTYHRDTPLSCGAGFSLETRAGILRLNYALGSQMGNGFDIRSGKIHFGLSALF